MAQRAPSRKQARRDAVFLLYQREVTSLSMEQLVVGHKLREGKDPVTRASTVFGLRLRAGYDAEDSGWTPASQPPNGSNGLRTAPNGLTY